MKKNLIKISDGKFSDLQKIFKKYEMEVVVADYCVACDDEAKPLHVKNFIGKSKRVLMPHQYVNGLKLLIEKGFFEEVEPQVFIATENLLTLLTKETNDDL